ncbi:hypothetical protein FOQG_14936 [Fusarium oxysporum f. sp. raphani 54005]|uniref:Heterokaryon incompatibility domain-containing protein n=1 Tax=Fusarium oxysporum f. sp. raphani 54005 TaxID=1089458 RepID=X0BQ21_FUSOX|nr:hypothetical protein FOQG_14936 [Fusarium oxysporum f. sp. raphani 54005]
MDQPAFKHQPLADPANQIRLLEVISLPDMPMELSLSVHEITKDSDYYAISYTWGDSCFTKEIIINGRPMMVTENCHYALTQVRDRYPSLHGTSIFIWIDSICINQNDNDEKSDQVAMMGNIYTRASKVLACIGPHQDNSHMIRNMLDSVVRLSPELYSLREEFPLKNNTGQPRFSTVFNNNDRLPQSKIEGFLEISPTGAIGVGFGSFKKSWQRLEAMANLKFSVAAMFSPSMSSICAILSVGGYIRACQQINGPGEESTHIAVGSFWAPTPQSLYQTSQ